MDRRAALCELFCASPAIALARQGLHGVCCTSSLSWYRCLGGCCVATGIYGMDFYVCLTRAGRRVSRRKYKTSRVGKQHKVSRDDAVAWFEKKFDGIVTGTRRPEAGKQ